MKASGSDYYELESESNRAFGHEPDGGFFINYLPKLYKKEYDTMSSHYIVKEDGKIAAVVGAFYDTMDVCGKLIKIGGIGTVCVIPEYRSRGYMKDLMNMAVDGMKTDGVDCAFLGGKRQRYEYFSFTFAGASLGCTFKEQNARYLYGADARFGYEFSDVKEDDSETLDKIYALYMRRMAKVLRDRNKLYDIMRTWDRHTVAITKNGEFRGYIILNADNNNATEFELCDMSAIGEVLNDIIRYYKTDRIYIGCIACFEKEKSRYLLMSAENYGISYTESTAIFNFRNVTEAFMKLKAECFSLVDGECSIGIENHGAIKLSVRKGVPSVEDFNGEPDVRMPYMTAVQRLFSPAADLYSFGASLPACAAAWFPLPLFYTNPDQV